MLLNRAPTLHRLGIQAFEPVLIEGKAIQLHPLVCAAFNADFDGDQMAVHVPLSIEAQMEARTLMMSTNNILFPANGEPIIVPSQDIVLGLYYATASASTAAAKASSSTSARCSMRWTTAVDDHRARSRASDRVGQRNGEVHAARRRKLVDTTVGRALLSEILPKGLPFRTSTGAEEEGDLAPSTTVFRHRGLKETVIFADKLLQSGFRLPRAPASRSPSTTCSSQEKDGSSIERPRRRSRRSNSSTSRRSSVTDGERYNKVVDIWGKPATGRQGHDGPAVQTKATARQSEVDQSVPSPDLHDGRLRRPRLGGADPPAGRHARPDGEAVGSIIETPITANFREGLNGSAVLHLDARRAARAWRTRRSRPRTPGYLTRRLVDVTQDLVVTEDDCGTERHRNMRALVEGGEVIERCATHPRPRRRGR